MRTVEEYFLLFAIYSFVGWCMETAFVSIQTKRFINRGFLIGPTCPIYGFGAISILIFLGKYASSPFVLFVMTVFICGILEYGASWVMEVIFKARWWDYSNKKFNINGRICIDNLIAFGVLGLLVVYVINPVLTNWINILTEKTINIFTIILGIVYLADMIISVIVIFGFRKVTKEVNKKEKTDNTEQITKMVRQVFSEKSFFHRRFIEAYPRLQAIKIKIKEIKEKIGNVTNDAKDAVIEKKDAIKSNIEKGTNQVKSKIEGKLKRK